MKGPIGVHYEAQIGIRNGSIADLSTIHREGDAIVESGAGMVMNVTLSAVLNNLDVSFIIDTIFYTNSKTLTKVVNKET